MAGLAAALSRLPARRPQPVPLELPLQSAPGRFGHDGVARLINVYAVNVGRGGKRQWQHYAVDGLKSFSTLTGGGQCRGLHDLTTVGLVVSARQLYTVDQSGTSNAVGGVPGAGFVTFATNRNATPQTVIVSEDGNALSYIGGTLAALSVQKPPNSCGYIDGYVLLFGDNGRVYFTALDDITSIGANDFFTAEASNDRLRRGVVHEGTVFLLGHKTIELWFNDGSTPFARVPGGFHEMGCASGASAAKSTRGVICVSNKGGVIRLNEAGGIEEISTDPVERSIARVSDKTTIEGFVDFRQGREFYHLSGPTFTWVCDLQNNLWYERESVGEDRWRGAQYMNFAEKRIVGDFESGLLYELDADTYDEAGNNMIVTVRFPVHAWPEPLSLKTLDVDMIPGVGLNSSDLHLSDPQLMMRVSKNGGMSWGTEATRSIGKIGQHTKTASFNKNDFGESLSDGYVVELRVSAAVARAFTGVSGEPEVKRR